MAVLYACSSATAPHTEPSLTGTWHGSNAVTLQGGANPTVTINLTLNESDSGTVTGSGTLQWGVAAPSSVTIKGGTVSYPNVSLVLESTGEPDVTFTGHFNSRVQILGQLDGSPFDGDPYILNRQN